MGSEFQTILAAIASHILNPFIGLLFGVALVLFLWGVFKFVKNADDPRARKEGAYHMLGGIIGMFIMVSVYGIFNLVMNSVPNALEPDSIETR